MCFVRGRSFGKRASSSAPELSSNALQKTRVTNENTQKPYLLISEMRSMMGTALRRLSDNARYSASVVLRQQRVCSRDAHVMGQSAKVMIKPVRDLAVLASCGAVARFQLPAKSASAQTSIDFSLFGSKIMPLSLVPFKYLQSHSIASPCDRRGSSENLAIWCTWYAMSGLVLFSRKFSFPTTAR